MACKMCVETIKDLTNFKTKLKMFPSSGDEPYPFVPIITNGEISKNKE